MHCDSCNTAFADEMKACPTCGSPVASQDAAPSPAYNLAGNEISYKEDIPFIDATASSTAPSTSITEQQPSNRVDTQQAMPVLTTPAQQLTRSTISTGTVIALTLLIVLLIIEGSGFAYYGAILRPTDLHTQATRVARTFLTAQANSTTLAQTQATATSTAMTPDELYKQATSGTPVIDDPLTAPGGNVFYQTINSANGCHFRGGAYHFSWQQPVDGSCVGLGAFTNFVMQAQVAIIQGNAAGLAFRIPDTQTSNYYLFVYGYSGYYGFYIMKRGQLIRLKEAYSSTIITKPSSPNLLTVIARNDHFYLYINKQSVDQVIDNTYSSSGQIGFFGGNRTGNMDAAFANLKVWEL